MYPKIDDLIWRMCVSKVKLNGTTKPDEFLIPRCDNTIITVRDGSNQIWVVNLYARQGYNQIPVHHVNREKLPSSHQTTKNICSSSCNLGPLKLHVSIQIR